MSSKWNVWFFITALCGGLFGGLPHLESREVVLMDGFLVDRLDPLQTREADTDAVPRRLLEVMFDAAPEALSLDLLPGAEPRVQDDEVLRRERAAQLHFDDRRWESALREYQQLMRLRPGHLEYVERAAVLATLARQYAVADAYFHDVITAKPNHANYLAAWGGVLIHLMRLDDAENATARSLRVQPDHLMARFNRLVLDVLDDRETDESYWRYRTLPEMAELASWLVSDQRDLKRVLGDAGFERVVQYILGSVSVADVGRLHNVLVASRQHLQLGEWGTAYERLQEALSLGADRIFLHMESVRCVLERGEGTRAVELADALMADQDNVPQLLYAHGYILIQAGAYDRAVEVFSLLDREGDQRPDYAFALACALAGAGSLDEAWPILTELAKNRPGRFPEWMEGDLPYLEAIRSDPRYKELPVPGL